MRRKKDNSLPLDTVIEVVKIKGDQVLKKTMTYREALSIKKFKGWQYINYQLGFSSIKQTKT